MKRGEVGMLAANEFDDADAETAASETLLRPAILSEPARRPVYPYYALLLLLMAFVSNQVNRLIITFIKEDIEEDIGITPAQYGFLVGYGFAVVFVLCGIPFGMLADRYSRKLLLVFGIFMWSTTTVMQGFATTYAHLLLSRIGLGIGEATFMPTALALLADYFELDQRAVPDSIFSLGSYLGAGIASTLGTRLAKLEGVAWSWTLIIFGLAGIFIALLTLATMKEPPRARVGSMAGRLVKHKSYSYKQTVFYMVTMDASWRLCLAGGVRMLSTFSLAAFLPAFFKDAYPSEAHRINYLYGTVLILGGVVASLCSGFLTRWWYVRDKRAPMHVAAMGSLAAAPFLALALLAKVVLPGNDEAALQLALSCLLVSFSLAEWWPGPSTFLLQSLLPQGMQGTGFGIYFAVVTLIGGAGPEVIALLQGRFPDGLQYVLLSVIVGGYVLSAIMFIWAGAAYQEDLITREIFLVGGDMTDALSRTRRIWLFSCCALLLAGAVAVITCTFTL